jgi:hypothetical protein
MILSKTKLLITITVFISFFTFACSKVTQENYEKIEVGMTYEEIIDILGKAQECNSAVGMSNCKWGADEKFIKIQFVSDKVILFSAKGLS